MSLTNRLKAHKGMTFSQAQSLAWKVIHMEDAMKTTAVSFSFVKKYTGEIRQAIGTMSSLGPGNKPFYQFCYFDLEVDAFRSFDIECLL